VERLLKPGGVLAVWCYNLLSVNPEIDALVNDFYHSTLGEYWPAERRLLEEGYRSIPFPYPKLSSPDFLMSRRWQRQDLIGYLGTWSAVKGYQQDRLENPVPALDAALAEHWSDDLTLEVHWPLSVHAMQKRVD